MTNTIGNGPDMRRAALWYARKGMYVFPVHAPLVDDERGYLCTCERYRHSEHCRKEHPDLYMDNGQHCARPGKHSWMVESWSKESTTNADTIAGWWKRHPDASIGIDCGKSGIVVVDFDTYKPEYDEGLYDALASDGFTETVTVSSGGGGTQLWFKQRDGNRIGSKNDAAPCVDVKGDGGYAVAPPSLHKSGNRYAFDAFFGLGEVEMLVAPDVVAALVQHKRPEPREPRAEWSRASAAEEIALVESMLGIIPPTTSGERDRWVKVMMAVKHHLGSDGWLSFDKWSARGDGYNYDDNLRQWESIESSSVTFGTLAKMARDADDAAYKKAYGEYMVSTKVKDVGSNGAVITLDDDDMNALFGFNPAQVVTNDRQQRSIVADAIKAVSDLVKSEPRFPQAMSRGGLVSRVHVDENGVPAIVQMDAGDLHRVLAAAADWVKEVETKSDVVYVSVPVPRDIPRMLLGSQELTNALPALAGLAECPVFTPQWELHSAAGYDQRSRVFLSTHIQLGDTEPTPANVKRSVDLIDYVLADFPFVDNASRSHAIALMLLPFVRPAIDGPTPMTLISAPQAGTGKGLLASVCLYPGVGNAVNMRPMVTHEDEWRKGLTSIMSSGTPAVIFDNLTGKLSSPSLATALTSIHWQDRMLQQSRDITAPIRTVWCATGNNVEPSEEIARRIVYIRLDANMEVPSERSKFKIKNMGEWLAEHRSELATACITIVRHWVAMGRPLFKDKMKGSYESWTRIVGGILSSVGIPGFLENDSELRESAMSESVAWQAFVEEWFKQHGGERVTTTQLFEIASIPDGLFNAEASGYLNMLADILGGGNERSRMTRLGRELNGIKDRVYAGYKINVGAQNGRTTYRLIRAE